MSSFMLPYISKRLANIEPVFSFDDESPLVVSKSLSTYLRKLKDSIDEVQTDWDVYKRFTNPYECLHSPSFGQLSQPVCPLHPISRSYFKMIEICNSFDVVQSMPPTMRSFHIAEGPGGFIEALSHLRANPDDTYVGITLLSEKPSVPGWKKSQDFLRKNPNVFIETGADGTGDITNERNLLFCSGKYGGMMDLVTADGGFDFSGDFNHQENQVGLLLVAQLAMATAVQKQGGTLIMKMFDVFTKLSLDIVYLVSLMYERVNIVKPNTSRYANSERYIVAQGFKTDNGRGDWTLQFAPILEKIPVRVGDDECDDSDSRDNDSKTPRVVANIVSLLNEDIPRYFVARVEESNASIGQQQMDVISNTLTLIKNPRQDKMERMRISSIQRCVLWCQKHNLPYNRDIRHFNMFLSAKNKVSRVPRKKSPRDEDAGCDDGGEGDFAVVNSVSIDGSVPTQESALDEQIQEETKKLCESIVSSVVDDV